MIGIIGVVTLLALLALSLIITRVATVALTMTGLSHEAARFQARSAFTGTGFTTQEAEIVVNHPVRRKIIMILMLLRSAGFVSIILSLILSFLGSGDDISRLHRLGWLATGVIVLWLLASIKRLERFMARVIEWALARWTDLDVRDYAHLLRLSGGYNIMELQVQEGDWVAGKNLRCCYLLEEGIMVLGITRSDGTYVGVPRGDTEVYAGDVLILYGQVKKLQQLGRRRADTAGDKAHEVAVSDEQQRMEEQKRLDAEHKRKREAGLI